jgi:VWFA-related protein
MSPPADPSVPSGPVGSYAYDESKVVFRTSSVLVQVPVVVTDKSGHHLRNLTKEQFEVLENGKAQKVATFEEIVTDTSHPLPPSPAGVFRNAGIEFHQPHAVTVIAIDTVNTPFLDQASARRVLARYLAENLNPGQLVAMVLISSKGLRVVQGLTSDPAPLIKTLNKLSGEFPAMQDVGTDTQVALATGSVPLLPANNAFRATVLNDFMTDGDVMYAQFKQENAIEVTMRSFLQIAWSLSGVPGRKSLIWATSGFPFYLGSPGMVPGGRLSTLYERAMESLNDAQIAVYPVDVRGLVSTSPGADAGTMGGATYARSLQGRDWLEISNIATLQEFAEMTGGRAFYHSNDLAEGFRRAADDSASYYLLGYYLDTKNDKPGWRKLKVKVQQKDASVHARSGFLVTNAAMNPQATKDVDLGFALNSPFEATGIPIWMQWQVNAAEDPLKSGEKKKVGFDLHFPGEVIGTQGDQNAIELDVFAVVATRGGGSKSTISDPIKHTMKATLTPETLAKVRVQGMKYSSDLPLPAGSYEVRFVVRDNVSGRVGSVSAPLTVN